MAYKFNPYTDYNAAFRKPEKSPLDVVNNDIALKALRIEDAGAEVPEKKSNLNTVLRILDILDRPRNVVASIIDSSMNPQEGDALQDLLAAVKGERKVYGRDLLDKYADAGEWNKAKRAIVGFGADILLDPLTYIGGFLGKPVGKALKGMGMQAAGDVAEKGLFRAVAAPRLKQFGKGAHYAASLADTRFNQLPVEDIGEGLMGALGRKVGNIPVPRGKNLGLAAEEIIDKVTLPFRPKGVSLRASTSNFYKNIEGITNAEEAQQIFRRASDIVQELGNDIPRNMHNALKTLTESIDWQGLGVRGREAIPTIIERPIIAFRQVAEDFLKANKLAIKEGLPNALPQEIVDQALDTGIKAMTYAADRNNLANDLFNVYELLSVTPGGSPDFIRLVQKKLALETASGWIDNAYEVARKITLDEFADDPQLLGKIDEAISVVKQLNFANYPKPTGRKIADYIYHTMKSKNYTTDDYANFFAINPELNYLSPKIASDNKRIMQTIADIEAQSVRNLQYNFAGATNYYIDAVRVGKIKDPTVIPYLQELAEIVDDSEIMDTYIRYGFDGLEHEGRVAILGALRKKAEDSITSLADDVILDARLDTLRKVGIQTNTLRMKPVLIPEKDGFIIQAAREIDGARQKAVHEAITKLEGTELVKRVSEAKDIVPEGWIKTDLIPGFPRGMAIHPEVARMVKNVDMTFSNDKMLKGLLEGFNKVQNMWKSSVITLRPGWYQTNLFGNIFNGWLAGVNDFSRYSDATMLQAFGKKATSESFEAINKRILKLTGNRYGASEFLKLADDMGIRGFGQTSVEFREGVRQMIGKAGLEAGIDMPAHMLPKSSTVMDKLRQVGSAMEDNAKVALFLDRIVKGDAPEQAALTVKKFLFDYSQLTSTERGLKTIVPFYTFTRKNLPLQLESIITQPHKYLAIKRAQEASFEAFDVPDQEINDMPDWFRGRAFAMGDNNYFAPLLPSDSINDFLSFDDPLQAFRGAANMVSPLIKTPLFELPMNTSTFLGQPIERYEGQTVNFLGVQIPAKLAYTLHQFGATRDMTNTIKMFQSNYENNATVSPADEKLGKVLGNLLSATFRNYNPEQAHLYNQYEYNDELNDLIKLLKDRGVNVRTATEIRKGAK